MAGHSAEEIRKHIRVYMTVFASLAVLTVVTVAVSYLHLAPPAAIALALVVAITKASLVALYFMHLISEQKTIYWVLGLTASFFVVLMYLPTGWYVTAVDVPAVWDEVPHASASAHGHDDEGHGEESGGHH